MQKGLTPLACPPHIVPVTAFEGKYRYEVMVGYARATHVQGPLHYLSMDVNASIHQDIQEISGRTPITNDFPIEKVEVHGSNIDGGATVLAMLDTMH